MLAARIPTADVLILGLVLIGAICVLGAAVWMVRRWLFSTPGKVADDGWTLQHLREMRAEGQITEDEFEALKAKALEASRPPPGRKDGAA